MLNKDAVYLDYAATAPILPEVREVMCNTMLQTYGNASSLHAAGHAAHKIVEEAREWIAKLIGAESEEIVFTSGGTEANNTITEIFRGEKIAVSAIEHPSILEGAKMRAGEVRLLPVDCNGRVDMVDVERAVEENARLVSVMYANNELGTLEPVRDVVECCRAKGAEVRDAVYVHTDATQALGKVKIDVKLLGVDYMTLSAHKIGGPIGVGALYVRKGAPFKSLLCGGRQENGRRAGTTNTAGIVGFGTAAKWCLDNWSCKKWAEVAKLRDRLRERILQEVPYSSCNSPKEGCLPNILNMSFQAAEGESIQLYLDAEGIIVGTGSACAAGDLRPSHAIMATCGDAEVAHSSIRFSLGLETTEVDIDRVMAVLPEVVEKLQSMSTVKVGERHE